jgi:uncharacterized repeat protein (TIGR01451 family)
MVGGPEEVHMRRRIKHGIWLITIVVLLGTAFPGMVWADADLVMSKDANDLTPSLNQNIVFTVQILNNGPNNTNGVEVTDNLPSGVGYVSYTSSQGTYNPGTGIWLVGTLNNGASAALYITVQVQTFQSVTNIASVSATSEPDPTPASASVTINDGSGGGTSISTGCGIDASSN